MREYHSAKVATILVCGTGRCGYGEHGVVLVFHVLCLVPTTW